MTNAPFPWFGGKSRAAHLVWDRFGNVGNYVEPFFGSGAVLLQRPYEPGIETINDKDCLVANFWRALQHDPDEVAAHADNPVNEADQHARHMWLCSQEVFRERMKTEHDFYDAKIAGYWVWGQCIWIGGGWCSVHLPGLGSAGKGVDRRRPHLGPGMGVHRSLLHLGDAGRSALIEYMRALAERLRRVRVCCGDWSRVCGPSPTENLGLTGVFLDPPYSAEADRKNRIYAVDDLSVAHDVRVWAIANGDNPLLRIALCGYEGEHTLPTTWECVSWKLHSGYALLGHGKGRDNARHERIWFSPNCLRPQESLFADIYAQQGGLEMACSDWLAEEVLARESES